jgi:hypothetical protein
VSGFGAALRGGVGGLIITATVAGVLVVGIDWSGLVGFSGGGSDGTLPAVAIALTGIGLGSLVALRETDVPPWHVIPAAWLGHAAGAVLAFPIGSALRTVIDNLGVALIVALAIGAAATIRLSGLGSLRQLGIAAAILAVTGGVVLAAIPIGTLSFLVIAAFPMVCWSVLVALVARSSNRTNV